MSYRKEKAVWAARLPRWREDAVGRLAQGSVFVVVCIIRDPGRYARVEIPVDHARSLAADLLAAADRADSTAPAVLQGTNVRQFPTRGNRPA
jgi:hypothetical protein